MIKKKVLLLTGKISSQARGGRAMLCYSHYKLLLSLCGEGLIPLQVHEEVKTKSRSLLDVFRGYLDGLTESNIVDALSTIKKEDVKVVFVDGSNFGEFVATLKQKIPGVLIVTFFHNVESRFFWGSFRQHKTLHALAVLIANYFVERKAVKYSDKIICLSNRDSHLLRTVYGKGASSIAPMVVSDHCPPSFIQSPSLPHEGFALFVGGNFYANRYGVGWFIREVVPRVDIRLVVVGHGFETCRQEFEASGKVIVVGSVDSLARWYMGAQFVVAPIFDGSGMKTKVAEALMYGKKIIGTPEAFSGYEHVPDRLGWICETAADFISAILDARESIDYSFDSDMRKIYEEYFSLEASRDIFKAAIN